MFYSIILPILVSEDSILKAYLRSPAAPAVLELSSYRGFDEQTLGMARLKPVFPVFCLGLSQDIFLVNPAGELLPGVTRGRRTGRVTQVTIMQIPTGQILTSYHQILNYQASNTQLQASKY